MVQYDTETKGANNENETERRKQPFREFDANQKYAQGMHAMNSGAR